MHRNEVVLVGRLSMAPISKELTGGTVLTQWRLAVRRPRGHPGFQRSDAIECATFDESVREALAEWRLDDIVQVEGAIRRRWWRGGNRYEVEVSAAHRVEPVPADPIAADNLPRQAVPDESGGQSEPAGRLETAEHPAPAEQLAPADQIEQADQTAPADQLEPTGHPAPAEAAVHAEARDLADQHDLVCVPGRGALPVTAHGRLQAGPVIIPRRTSA
jgi:single-stranded DNA-binding protein